MLLDLFGLWYSATKRGAVGGFILRSGRERRVFDTIDNLLAFVASQEEQKLEVVKKLKTAKRIRKAKPPIIRVETESQQVQIEVDKANERIRREFERVLTERINELDDEDVLIWLIA
jgi:hypothetical protein